MSIEGISKGFGLSGRAVSPVSPVPHANHATEYPSSGQQRQPEKQPPRTPVKDGEVAPADDKGVIYNAKGEIVPLDTPGRSFTG